MTKDEFLTVLDRKLQVINEKERKDIIDEYRTHIEMKMEEGKSEEEAIEDFGNIDELVDEILDAYKINTNRVNHSFDYKFNHFMDELFDGFKRFIGSFTSLEVDDVVRLIFEILIILVLLAVLHIPFNIVSSLGASLLRSLVGFGIGFTLATIWKIVIGLAYAVIFIVVLVNLCTKRVRRYRNHESNRNSTVFDDFKESFNFDQAKETVYDFTSTKPKEEGTEGAYKQGEHTADTTNEEAYTGFERREDRERRRQERYAQRADANDVSSLGNSVGSVLSVFMKIFFCLLVIPFIGIVIGLSCALGAMVVLSIQGLTMFGAYFIVIGSLIVTGAFISLLHSVLWKRG